jgi:hypothetical protein
MAEKVTQEMIDKLLAKPIDESKYYIPKMYEDTEDKEKKK